ncbi:MAG: 2-alkenal reductase, partial [Deltaproteobacteria bacterium]
MVMKKKFLSLLVFLACIGIGFWLVVFQPLQRSFFDSDAEPRAVTARGDLAADEVNTIEVFRENSASVVYVTSIAVKRGFFSLNAVAIPQGTGSGFIWDDEGRIVTNYHVISDASRIQVTMADH